MSKKDKDAAYKEFKKLSDNQKALLLEAINIYTKSDEVKNGDIIPMAEFGRSGY